MRPRKAPRLVPKLVLGATFVAVVPACALVACGGSISGGDGGPGDAQSEILLGVAAVAYCCFDATMGVADVAFIKDAHDGG
jgi:hypothetical protein